MSVCEKCWADASLRAATSGGLVAEHYLDLLRERADNPCRAAVSGHAFMEPCGQTAGTDHCWLCGEPKGVHGTRNGGNAPA